MSGQQYLRICTLLISNNKGDSLDLSELHIKFSIKRSDTQTPNMAEIRVYNLEEKTAQRIQKEFSKVILQGGYESNFGVIFQGNVKQIILGRENSTDTFIDIVAGDGDLSYNFAIVNTTIAAGAGHAEQINAAISSMNPDGTTLGHVSELPPTKLPRGKVMYGMARDYLKQTADTTKKTWSIQDGKVQFVSTSSYLPGTAIQLTSKTGLIGTPNQTTFGVNMKCLLNPLIKVGGRVQIDNNIVARLKINLAVPLSPENIPAPVTADGVYYVLVIEHEGDNRGQEWYTNLTCLNINTTTNPINSVNLNPNVAPTNSVQVGVQ
jgi:hypothetical protein